MAVDGCLTGVLQLVESTFVENWRPIVEEFSELAASSKDIEVIKLENGDLLSAGNIVLQFWDSPPPDLEEFFYTRVSKWMKPTERLVFSFSGNFSNYKRDLLRLILVTPVNVKTSASGFWLNELKKGGN
jgi:hypothetical protein